MSTPTEHGHAHRKSVEERAIALGCDKRLAALFAEYHDSERKTGDCDPKHGERAAKVLLKKRPPGLSTLEFVTLLYAIAAHDVETLGGGGYVTSDPTVAAMWDADRLDLTRFGVDPRYAGLSSMDARGAFSVITRSATTEELFIQSRGQ